MLRKYQGETIEELFYREFLGLCVCVCCGFTVGGVGAIQKHEKANKDEGGKVEQKCRKFV
jgi:hypothetical protein